MPVSRLLSGSHHQQSAEQPRCVGGQFNIILILFNADITTAKAPAAPVVPVPKNGSKLHHPALLMIKSLVQEDFLLVLGALSTEVILSRSEPVQIGIYQSERICTIEGPSSHHSAAYFESHSLPPNQVSCALVNRRPRKLGTFDLRHTISFKINSPNPASYTESKIL